MGQAKEVMEACLVLIFYQIIYHQTNIQLSQLNGMAHRIKYQNRMTTHINNSIKDRNYQQAIWKIDNKSNISLSAKKNRINQKVLKTLWRHYMKMFTIVGQQLNNWLGFQHTVKISLREQILMKEITTLELIFPRPIHIVVYRKISYKTLEN